MERSANDLSWPYDDARSLPRNDFNPSSRLYKVAFRDDVYGEVLHLNLPTWAKRRDSFTKIPHFHSLPAGKRRLG